MDNHTSNTSEYKTCTKCGEVKTRSEFHKKSSSRDGINSACKQCVSIRGKKYYLENKENILLNARSHYLKNKDIVLDRNYQYRLNNKEKIAERKRQYALENIEHIAKYQRQYRKEHTLERAEHQREWRRKNPERLAEHSRKYRQLNKEKIAEAQRIHRQKNSEYYVQYRKNWRECNREKINEYGHRYRARKYQNGIFEIREKFLKKLYSSSCIVCDSVDRIEADHVIPVSRGGTNSEGNLQPLCFSCNRSKGNKLMVEWIYLKGGGQDANQ